MKVENPFKTKLYNYTIPVREELWDAIEKQLPPAEQQRKFPVFWMILFASAIISGALMFGTLTHQSEADKSTNPTTPTTPSHDVSAVNTQDNTTASTSNSIPNSISNSGSSSNANSGINAGSSSISTSKGSTHNSTSSSPHAVVASSGNSMDSNAGAENSDLPATGNRNAQVVSNQGQKSIAANKSNTSTPHTPKAGKSSVNTNRTPGISGNKLNEHAAPVKPDFTLAGQPAENNSASTPETNTNDEAANALLVESRRNAMHSTNRLPLALLEELTALEMAEASMMKIKPDPSCYKFSGLAGKYYISVDAFGGPGFSPQTFSATGPESTNYIAARNATERNQYAWSAGARVNLHLESGFALRMGLLYDQAGDVFDYTDTLATQSTTQIDSFFAADGTFLYTETNHVLIFGTLIKKIHNTYRHLDIPLLASYELPLGRSSLMINAGPVFNLSSSYEGQILDPMLHPRTISTDASNELPAYKTSLGLSFYVGVGGVFPLTDHIAAIVEPRYLYRIKPVTLKSYTLEEHRHFAGLNLGLRYFLH